jgi:hypothetical protein
LAFCQPQQAEFYKLVLDGACRALVAQGERRNRVAGLEVSGEHRRLVRRPIGPMTTGSYATRRRPECVISRATWRSLMPNERIDLFQDVAPYGNGQLQRLAIGSLQNDGRPVGRLFHEAVWRHRRPLKRLIRDDGERSSIGGIASDGAIFSKKRHDILSFPAYPRLRMLDLRNQLPIHHFER